MWWEKIKKSSCLNKGAKMGQNSAPFVILEGNEAVELLRKEIFSKFTKR